MDQQKAKSVTSIAANMEISSSVRIITPASLTWIFRTKNSGMSETEFRSIVRQFWKNSGLMASQLSAQLRSNPRLMSRVMSSRKLTAHLRRITIRVVFQSTSRCPADQVSDVLTSWNSIPIYTLMTLSYFKTGKRLVLRNITTDVSKRQIPKNLVK